LLGYLRDIQIAQFKGAIALHKHVGGLQVSVQNLLFVQRLESTRQLEQRSPDFELLEIGLVLFVLYDSVVQVASVRKIHHDAQTTRQVVEKSFFVSDNVGVLNRGEDADFVERVGLFFFGQLLYFDLRKLV